MREIRSSGSVGELPGNRWLYPEVCGVDPACIRLLAAGSQLGASNMEHFTQGYLPFAERPGEPGEFMPCVIPF